MRVCVRVHAMPRLWQLQLAVAKPQRAASPFAVLGRADGSARLQWTTWLSWAQLSLARLGSALLCSARRDCQSGKASVKGKLLEASYGGRDVGKWRHGHFCDHDTCFATCWVDFDRSNGVTLCAMLCLKSSLSRRARNRRSPMSYISFHTVTSKSLTFIFGCIPVNAQMSCNCSGYSRPPNVKHPHFSVQKPFSLISACA